MSLPDGATSPRRVGALLALGVALAAGGALLVDSPAERAAPAPGRMGAATAWQRAQRADIPGSLADAAVYRPGIFLDARTSVGTAPSPDGSAIRLVRRAADGTVGELRRLPVRDNPQFESLTVAGDVLAWAEATDNSTFTLWAVDLRDGAPPRRLTADTGNAVFYGSQYDLVVADGRVHWAAARPGDTDITEIRSVPTAGGPVEVHIEAGIWALTAWPWLVNGVSDPTGTTRLRNMGTRRDVTVPTSAGQTATCSPGWCRVMVMSADGSTRIDLMRPDGTGRRRVAGGTASSAIADVAPLDRFEVLSEPGPNSELTGTARLLVYDIATGATVDLSPDAGNASYRGGVLWWSTGNRDAVTWHSVDLRTA